MLLNNNNNIYSPQWPEPERATAHHSWLDLYKGNTNETQIILITDEYHM